MFIVEKGYTVRWAAELVYFIDTTLLAYSVELDNRTICIVKNETQFNFVYKAKYKKDADNAKANDHDKK